MEERVLEEGQEEERVRGSRGRLEVDDDDDDDERSLKGILVVWETKKGMRRQRRE